MDKVIHRLMHTCGKPVDKVIHRLMHTVDNLWIKLCTNYPQGVDNLWICRNKVVTVPTRENLKIRGGAR